MLQTLWRVKGHNPLPSEMLSPELGARPMPSGSPKGVSRPLLSETPSPALGAGPRLGASTLGGGTTVTLANPATGAKATPATDFLCEFGPRGRSWVPTP